MYQGMYDPKHRFLAISSTPSKRVRFHQKGLREQLLCADCERLFSRFETYAAEVFYGNGVWRSYQRHGDIVEINGLDYKKLKLFLLSLLWRFGVTTVPQLKGAKLGPHSERLRQMLLAENPGDPALYRCLITVVMWEGKHFGGLIVPPCLSRMDGRHIWLITVAGIVFTFFVSAQLPVNVTAPAFLQKNGSMSIQMRDLTKIEFLHRYVCEIAEAERKREPLNI
jgi:hypothetical protein